MGEWKGSWSSEKNCRNEGRGDQSSSWKSPQSRDLALEKEFCRYLSSIPWRRLCDAQKYTYIYKNVLQWDDSGALESFQAARSRFEKPCENPLPDPNMYIDQIDHDCVIDPELIAEIEKELVPPPETTKARHRTGTGTGTGGWDSVEGIDRHVPATGWESWGDSGDKDKDKEKDKEKDNSKNWDIYVENKPVECTGWGDNDWSDDAWDRGNKPTGWGNNNDISNNNNGWNDPWNNNSWDRRNNEANSRNGRKRDGSIGNNGFRVRKIRYMGDRCHPGNNWRGSRGRNNRNYPYNAAFS